MLTSRIVPRVARQMQVRNTSFCHGSGICTPPTTRVSFPEKVGFGVLMTACFLTIPMWVMGHMEEYKAPK